MNAQEKDLVRYRLTRARETLEEAEYSFGGGHLYACVNRIYYACFYAASALLLCKGLSASRHGGVRALFHREFVKTGLISEASAKFYDRLFDERMHGDYEDFSSFEAKDVKTWLARAPEFIAEVEKTAARFISS